MVLALLDAAGASGALLDFGMGPGVFALDVTRRGFHYTGIDISSAMIERAEALGVPGATFFQGDLDALSQFRGAADVVLAIGLIDYLEDPVDGLRRLAGCLKPRGTLIVSFRNRRTVNTVLRNTARRIWSRFFARSKWRADSAFAAAVHERAYSFRTDLRALLGGLGMADFRIRYLNFTPFLFFNVPLPRWLWLFWLGTDRRLAGSATRWVCSAGVVSCRNIR